MSAEVVRLSKSTHAEMQTNALTLKFIKIHLPEVTPASSAVTTMAKVAHMSAVRIAVGSCDLPGLVSVLSDGAARAYPL